MQSIKNLNMHLMKNGINNTQITVRTNMIRMTDMIIYLCKKDKESVYKLMHLHLFDDMQCMSLIDRNLSHITQTWIGTIKFIH